MERTTPRTCRLTERVAAECRLAPADVAFLLDAHRDHVRLVPTGRRHRYRLTPTGHVGVIAAPACRLVIRPKIPVRNLFFMLDPTAALPVSDDFSAPMSGSEVLDFLTGRLVRLMEERAAAGLHRAYAERADAGPFLQGRLDVPAQLREPGIGKDRFHCRYEDFTVDMPCNQVPRATAELLLRSPLPGDNMRAALRQSLIAFAGVQAIDLDRNSFTAAAPDRLTETYRPLLELCRLLVDGLAPGEVAGTVPGPAFLLDMERVFERYVTAGIQKNCTGNVALQPFVRAHPPVADQPDIHMRPDLVIERDGRPVLVLDVKWKSGSLPRTEDVYQIVTYATVLGVRRAVLVYPGRRDRVWTYPLAGGALAVEVRTLRVTGTKQACIRSLELLQRAVC